MHTLVHRTNSCLSKYAVIDDIEIVRPSGLFRVPRSIKSKWLLRLSIGFERRFFKKYINNDDIIIIGNPFVYDIIEGLPNKILIFDCMDDQVLLLEQEKQFQLIAYLEEVQRKLIEKSDVVIFSANQIKENIIKRYNIENLNYRIISNGFKKSNLEHPPNNTTDQLMRFLYIGTIGEWFDTEAIALLAEEYIDWEIHIAGPVKNSNFYKLMTYKNIVYHGILDHDQCMEMVSNSGVCLFPFKDGELIDTINPVKIYEYAQFNKPIISIYSNELKRQGFNLFYYHDLIDLKYISSKAVQFALEDKALDYSDIIRSKEWRTICEEFYNIISHGVN